ncbi:MAG: flagellar hook capping FlgD N-terminal domain-containing protein [Proteocatella sp.]
MSEIIRNITPFQTGAAKSTDNVQKQQSKSNTKASLEMDDFLALLVKQLQNQDMMNPMDDTAFMNQMTQMATVQAMNTFTDVSVTTYAASLVGKEVTVAELDAKDEMKEIEGLVTGAAVYGGEHVIFINGKSYSLTQIMAIGKLPPKEETPEEPEEGTPPVVETK